MAQIGQEGLPVAMQQVLDQDRRARKLDKRTYLVDLLAERYRLLLEKNGAKSS
jgi:hypothetical protein